MLEELLIWARSISASGGNGSASAEPTRSSPTDPQRPQATTDVTHPHVRDNQLCEGEGAAAIKAALARPAARFLPARPPDPAKPTTPAAPMSRSTTGTATRCADCGCEMSEDDLHLRPVRDAVCGDCSAPAAGLRPLCLQRAAAATAPSATNAFCAACLTDRRTATAPPALQILPRNERTKHSDDDDDQADDHRRLRLTPYAWAKLLRLRDLGDTEVGGFGISAADDLLLVEDVRLVRQQCTPVTVKFDDEAVADYFDGRSIRAGRPSSSPGSGFTPIPATRPSPAAPTKRRSRAALAASDWAVMFILARGGQTYARLRFNAGPGGDLVLPVEIDFARPFAAADWAAWDAEYAQSVVAGARPARRPSTATSQCDSDRAAARPAWIDVFAAG